MAPDSRFQTLYEDWKVRLQRLEGLPQWTGDYHAMEIQLLKYLLHRYRDSAEGARPARFPLKSELYINHRALVVFHHLAEGRFPTMANAEQTLEHVKAVLERMASQSPAERAADELESPWPETAPSIDRSVDALRLKLSDSDSQVRVRAIVDLGEVGNLDDIGLLSDLLALPPSSDEHPRERPALVHALQRLAGIQK